MPLTDPYPELLEVDEVDPVLVNGGPGWGIWGGGGGTNLEPGEGTEAKWPRGDLCPPEQLAARRTIRLASSVCISNTFTRGTNEK